MANVLRPCYVWSGALQRMCRLIVSRTTISALWANGFLQFWRRSDHGSMVFAVAGGINEALLTLTSEAAFKLNEGSINRPVGLILHSRT